MSQPSPPKIPIYINVCGLLVLTSSLISAYAGLIRPEILFSFFSDVDWQSNQLPFLNGLWGTRNLSLALVMLLALFFQNSAMMFAIFLARFITELQDIFLLAPLRIDPTGIAIPETLTLFDRFMGVFPVTVLLAEIFAIIGLVRLMVNARLQD